MLHVETTPSAALDSARVQNKEYLDQMILPGATVTANSFNEPSQASLSHSFQESKAELNISRVQLLNSDACINTDPSVRGRKQNPREKKNDSRDLIAKVVKP